MTTTTTYEIVIKGRATDRFLRLLVDDFVIDHGIDGVTRVTGAVRDPAHLHGIVAHLTSVGAELISIGPSTTPEHTATELPDLHPSTTNETSNP
jgi:hypothetical protein